MPHHSRLSTLVLDCKVDDLATSTEFWSRALGKPVASPDQDGDGAVRSRLRGPRRPHRNVRSVARPLARLHRPSGEEDDPAPDGVRVGLHGLVQRLERFHPDQGRRDPFRRCSDAPAERRDDEGLAKRRDDLGRLGAPLPDADGDLLGAHVREPELPEERLAPGDRRPVHRRLP